MRSAAKVLKEKFKVKPDGADAPAPYNPKGPKIPVNMSPDRKLVIADNCWLVQFYEKNHIQNAYGYFLQLKALMEGEKGDKSEFHKTIEASAEMFDILEAACTVTYDDFYEHTADGSVKRIVGQGRAAQAPCFNPKVDNVLISQITNSTWGLVMACANSDKIKKNFSQALPLICELLKFSQTVKSSHDRAVQRVNIIEQQKEEERMKLEPKKSDDSSASSSVSASASSSTPSSAASSPPKEAASESSELSKKPKVKNKYKSKYKRLKDDVTELRQLLFDAQNNAQQKEQQLQITIEMLEEKLSRVVEEQTTASSKSDEEAQRKFNDITKLKAELDSASKQLVDAAKRHAENEREIRKLRQEIETAKKEQIETQSRFEQEKDRLAELGHQKSRDASSAYKALHAEMRETNERATKLYSELASKNAEVTRLQEQLRAIVEEQARKQVEPAVVAAPAQPDLQRRLEQAESARQAAEADSAAKSARITTLMEQLQSRAAASAPQPNPAEPVQVQANALPAPAKKVPTWRYIVGGVLIGLGIVGAGLGIVATLSGVGTIGGLPLLAGSVGLIAGGIALGGGVIGAVLGTTLAVTSSIQDSNEEKRYQREAGIRRGLGVAPAGSNRDVRAALSEEPISLAAAPSQQNLVSPNVAARSVEPAEPKRRGCFGC